MPNVFISQSQAAASADRERLERASQHPSGGTIGIFHRFFKKKESAEEQIARLEKEVADAHAAAVGLRQDHERLVSAVREVEQAISNARIMLGVVTEKRAEAAHWCCQKITSPRTARVEVIRWSNELNDIDVAIVRCEDVIAQLNAELPVKQAALGAFETEHAADLAQVPADAS